MTVLVSAASKHGATSEIARALADSLRQRGLEVAVLEPEEASETDGYDAVVLGSAVYAGHWMKPAKALAARLSTGPEHRPVWLFSSGPVGDPPKPAEDPVDIADVRSSVEAVEHRVFAGRIDKSLLGFGERAIVAALRVPAGDYRDWDEIREWGDEIADVISGAPRAHSAAGVAAGQVS
jgi:menaquinone-dependent protoporphyrinogen oxidase